MELQALPEEVFIHLFPNRMSKDTFRMKLTDIPHEIFHYYVFPYLEIDDLCNLIQIDGLRDPVANYGRDNKKEYMGQLYRYDVELFKEFYEEYFRSDYRSERKTLLSLGCSHQVAVYLYTEFFAYESIPINELVRSKDNDTIKWMIKKGFRFIVNELVRKCDLELLKEIEIDIDKQSLNSHMLVSAIEENNFTRAEWLLSIGCPVNKNFWRTIFQECTTSQLIWVFEKIGYFNQEACFEMIFKKGDVDLIKYALDQEIPYDLVKIVALLRGSSTGHRYVGEKNLIKLYYKLVSQVGDNPKLNKFVADVAKLLSK